MSGSSFTGLNSARLVAFLATTKPEESLRFYQDRLKLAFLADEPFALVFDANGIMLRVAKMDHFEPAPFTVLGWLVDDLYARIDELALAGVHFEHFEGIEQDEHGVAAFGGGTRVAWFKDPDGNLLSLSQMGNTA